MLAQNEMKKTKVFELYNMLQDTRHLLVIDLRYGSLFDLGSIRGSISISSDANKFLTWVAEQEKKAGQNEEKYKTKPIRRIIFVHEDPEKILIEKDNILELISSTTKDYKLYYLNNPIQCFIESFQFLIVSQTQLSEYYQPSSNNEVSENQRQVLFAYSQFPQILVENQIYLGNNYNSNSEKQLSNLKIKSLMDFNAIDNNQEIDTKVSIKQQQFEYTHVPIDVSLQCVIDFNEINQKIDSLQKPIMLYCQDGNTKTNVFAISYLIWKTKLRCDIATLKVFQIRGSTVVDKGLYAQLMQYNPKVQIIKV